MSRLWSQDCATTKSRIKSEHQQRERKKTVGANKGKGRELNPFSLHRQGDGGLLSSFEGDLRLVILALPLSVKVHNTRHIRRSQGC